MWIQLLEDMFFVIHYADDENIPFVQNGADHSEKAAKEVAEEKHENGNGMLCMFVPFAIISNSVGISGFNVTLNRLVG